MATSTIFTVNFTDPANGSITLAPGTFNGPIPGQALIGNEASDLRLYGLGTVGWGEGVDENFIHLLENFASPQSAVTPGTPKNESEAGPGAGINNPVKGQLWFNTTDNKLYVYTTTSTWEKVSADTVSLELNDLTNVTAVAPSNGQVLQYTQGTPGFWSNKTLYLNSLYDVNTAGVGNGKVLMYSQTATQWVPATLPAGVTTLDGLTDVNTAGADVGTPLVYNGSGSWVPGPSLTASENTTHLWLATPSGECGVTGIGPTPSTNYSYSQQDFPLSTSTPYSWEYIKWNRTGTLNHLGLPAASDASPITTIPIPAGTTSFRVSYQLNFRVAGGQNLIWTGMVSLDPNVSTFYTHGSLYPYLAGVGFAYNMPAGPNAMKAPNFTQTTWIPYGVGQSVAIAIAVIGTDGGFPKLLDTGGTYLTIETR